VDVEVGEETHERDYSIIGRPDKQNLRSEIERTLRFLHSS
jgi:hypothetical protein